MKRLFAYLPNRDEAYRFGTGFPAVPPLSPDTELKIGKCLYRLLRAWSNVRMGESNADWASLLRHNLRNDGRRKIHCVLSVPLH